MHDLFRMNKKKEIELPSFLPKWTLSKSQQQHLQTKMLGRLLHWHELQSNERLIKITHKKCTNGHYCDPVNVFTYFKNCFTIKNEIFLFEHNKNENHSIQFKTKYVLKSTFSVQRKKKWILMHVKELELLCR